MVYYNHPMMYGREQEEEGAPESPTGQQVPAAPQAAPPAAPQQQPSPTHEYPQPQYPTWYYQHHHPQHNQQQQMQPQPQLQLQQQQHHHHHHHQFQHQHQQHFMDAAVAESSFAAHWPHPHAAYIQYHQQQWNQQQMQIVAASNIPPTQQHANEWCADDPNDHGNNSNNGTTISAAQQSPALTISGSEISSPGTPPSPPVIHNNNNNIAVPNNNVVVGHAVHTGHAVHAVHAVHAAHTGRAGHSGHGRPHRSPFEWMKRNSHHPNPGKTRTKEKYRVVYTENQRLELEKEFYSSKYITIRRKAELASTLALSERQVKIWFQNRRAKERKQTKKRGDLGDLKPLLDAHGSPLMSSLFGSSSLLVHHSLLSHSVL